MQQLVEYINQFEKENITTAVENVANSSYIEIAPIIQSKTQMQTTPDSNKESRSHVDIDAIENSSKLRLSSSSLSSSAESSSNDINNDYEDIFAVNNDLDSDTKNNTQHETMATIKITPNETNPMIVSTNNLNSILTSSENIDKNSVRNNQISSQFIDRRTYIINKVYDTLENNKIPRVEDNLNDEEDEYEKVVLNPRVYKNSEVKDASDYGEYHNSLLVTSNETIQNKNNELIKVITKPIDNNEHIYANVNLNENDSLENKIIPRESLGFEVNELLLEKPNVEKSFDSEIIELNSQINNLLSSDSGNHKEIIIQNNTKIPSDFLKRRATTLSSCSNNSMDTNKEIFIKNNDQVIEQKPVSFRSKSCSTESSEKNQSDSSESIGKFVLKHEHKHEVRHSFRVQSIAEKDKINSNVDMNFKRKSSQSFEELNKKKSENFENSNSNNKQNEDNSNFKILAKHRQSIQPASQIDTTSLTNTNRSMSKSLQDNSKLINLSEFKTSNEDISESTSNETNVKSKIKLMESFVGNQSTNQIPMLKLKKNERSSSTCSSASSSSSKSPPLSPHLICSVTKSETSTSLFTTSSSNETKQIATSKQNPPMVMARSVILTQSSLNNSNNTSLSNDKEEIQPLKSTVIIIDSENKKASTENNEIIIKNPTTNIKEKRKTVKEMISKFEPK
jgi:hypothetical protein